MALPTLVCGCGSRAAASAAARPRRDSYRPAQAPDATPVVQQSSLSLCVDSPQCAASSARVPLIRCEPLPHRTPFGLRPVSEFSYGGEARPLYDPDASGGGGDRPPLAAPQRVRRPARALVPHLRHAAAGTRSSATRARTRCSRSRARSTRARAARSPADVDRLRGQRASRCGRATRSPRPSTAAACAPSRAPSSTTGRAASTACRATARTASCTVDGEVDVRACECAARDGQTVVRQNAWPSVDRDALNVFDKMHRRCRSASTTRRWRKPEVRVAGGREDDPQGGRARLRATRRTARATSSAPTGTPTCS